ncbi:MAG TPA: L,D-transpeptidase [Longimicrobiales bacterium]|nr:L,D-transpeptidase [Longimicrobiales bacterium]
MTHGHILRTVALAAGFGVAAVTPSWAQVNEASPGAPEAAATIAPANAAVYRAAMAYRGTKIMVSTAERRLRLLIGSDTVLDVPVAVGMGEDFEFEGRRFRFETPTGRRTVLSKSENPIWTVPDWHYMEKAANRGLKLVKLKEGDRVELADGTFIVVKERQVGRINQFGNFWPFTPGTEIMFDDRIFMPPMNSEQRRVPEALGPYKLELGDGYLIHGTNPYNEDSVGQAVSHGCVRMANEDLDRLYWLVEPRTPVFIY